MEPKVTVERSGVEYEVRCHCSHDWKEDRHEPGLEFTHAYDDVPQICESCGLFTWIVIENNSEV